jgi:short-subunit dehydrogenase
VTKTCIIVGVGPGIGKALAQRFGREGFTIGLVARNAEKMAAIAAELGQAGISAKCQSADAGDPAKLRAALAALKDEIGTPSVLVYNAAAVTPLVPSALSHDQLLQDFRVGVAGALVAVQAVVPDMRDKARGTILLTGGGFAFEPMANLASLGIEKAGLRNLAFSLAGELGPAGIHVATVTIGGMVKPGTFFAPEKIAEEYWRLHADPAMAAEREIVYRPAN